ncbi:DUF1634 domain-containing protein [Desulfosporosinus sp. Sb-LF]|uniref:DUF1634 domain-containing protein n=1 Tax=Desulfosporosinus sp. Sb-LF TaxID=2560027 RepID=UPI00107F82C6|nr:DUF1634 domain-containing protein [Desulfosporosinus sp. Sb-LF]TGE31552.1 DUF1634 domain-containing protein [Desulfosporosinus sp. Sb-LF]
MSSQTFVQNNRVKSVVISQPKAIVSTNVEVSPEQNRYASILLVCSWAGIIVMLITFLLYMGGLFNPLVKPSDMPLYWGLNVHQYLQVTHAPSGWDWMRLINHADYLNLVGLAFLGIVSVLGYISLFIDYSRKKDFPFLLMVALEILVITLAASGIFRISGGA